MIKEIIIVLGILSACFAAYIPFFRRDYHYDSNYDAFYKVHLDVKNLSYEEALNTCNGEGAKLFYPKLTDELKNLRPLIPTDNEYILVGLYNEIGIGQLITVDGLPTPIPLAVEGDEGGNCVYMHIDSGATRFDTCPTRDGLLGRGFVCKRERVESCPTIDKEYQYDQSTNKCYKVNKKPKSWLDAMKTCFMEGGSLLVTRNKMEREIIISLLSKQVNENTDFFVGYRQSHYNNQFYTVKGESLIDGFYVINNGDSNDYENTDIYAGDCGIYQYKVYNGYRIYDRNYPCEVALPFICEIAIETSF